MYTLKAITTDLPRRLMFRCSDDTADVQNTAAVSLMFDEIMRNPELVYNSAVGPNNKLNKARPRSNPWRFSIKILLNSQKETPQKRDAETRCFLVNFVKPLRTPI